MLLLVVVRSEIITVVQYIIKVTNVTLREHIFAD
jgi:hypothetical protein